jgi:hypothetical protein
MSFTVLDQPQCESSPMHSFSPTLTIPDVRIRGQTKKQFFQDIVNSCRDGSYLEEHHQKEIIHYLQNGLKQRPRQPYFTASSYNFEEDRHIAPKGGMGLPKSVNGAFYAPNNHPEFRTLLKNVDQSRYPRQLSKVPRAYNVPKARSLTPTQTHVPTPNPSPKPPKTLPEIFIDGVQAPPHDWSVELRDALSRRAHAEEKWQALQQANALVAPSYTSVIKKQDTMAVNPEVDALPLLVEQVDAGAESVVPKADTDNDDSGIVLDDTVLTELELHAGDSSTFLYPDIRAKHEVSASPDSAYGTQLTQDTHISTNDNDNDDMEMDMPPPPPRKKAVPKKPTRLPNPRRSIRISELRAKSQTPQPSGPSMLGKRGRGFKTVEAEPKRKRDKRS